MFANKVPICGPEMKGYIANHSGLYMNIYFAYMNLATLYIDHSVLIEAI